MLSFSSLKRNRIVMGRTPYCLHHRTVSSNSFTAGLHKFTINTHNYLKFIIDLHKWIIYLVDPVVDANFLDRIDTWFGPRVGHP